MRRYRSSTLCAAIVTITLLVTACPSSSNFARQLRLVFTASGPFVESLPLPPALKTGLITDFTDMGGDAATLGDCLHTASDKPAKLICVQSFDTQVETIIARGHFGQANNPRLQQILGLIRGIIASARIYYSASPAGANAPTVTEQSIKAQVEELKQAMKVQ